MTILVTADSLLLMFIGWTGAGIYSFLLVNFWYTRIAENQTSILGLLTNRIGDCFLTIGIFAILWTFGNFIILLWYFFLDSLTISVSDVSELGGFVYLASPVFKRWHSSLIPWRENLKITQLFSSLATQQQIKLDPNWISGFVDGEGSFMVFIQTNPKLKTGWRIQTTFSITIHEKDRMILELIQKIFGVGNITKQGEDGVQYRVESIRDLIHVIIPHFDKYPLLTQKKVDFLLFKEIVNLMNRKEQLTNEGLYKIVAIKASMNRGLSDELKKAFPNIVPVPRSLIVNQVINDPNWVAGFTSVKVVSWLKFLNRKQN